MKVLMLMLRQQRLMLNLFWQQVSGVTYDQFRPLIMSVFLACSYSAQP
jgi:hypothetical protein